MSPLRSVRAVTLAAAWLATGPMQAAASQGLTIPQIQGRGDTSPLVGKTVKTKGVVTAIRKVRADTFFFVQDAAGDNDPTTSDAVVVVSKSRDIKVGDSVSVEGQVTETTEAPNHLSVTTISPAIIIKTGTAGLPSPVVIGQGGRSPVTEAIAGRDPERSGIPFFETLEGMLVTVEDAGVVGPTNKFGEMWVVGDHGAHATGMNSYGGITSTPGDSNPERIQVQFDKTLVDPTNYQLKVGDRLASVTGVLNYSFGNYEIIATTAGSVTSATLPSSPPLESGPQFVTVGSYNVENLDPKNEDLAKVYDKDEIDDDVGKGRFAKIAEHIVNSLGSPDVMALQEIQDNDGAEVSDVIAADETLKTLTAAIKAAGGRDYKWIDMPPVDDEEGGQPGGNIRCAILYDDAKAKPDLSSVGRITDPSFEATRLPLVARFAVGDKHLTVIDVHLSSKGGSDPLFGKVQPPKDGTLSKRTEQARAIKTFVRTLPDQNDPVIIVGDFNTLWFEEPLQVLTGGTPAFENLTLRDAPLERFSYVFEGNSQALDHALISAGASTSADFRTFHVNSVYPEEQQMSDHDPKVVRLRLSN
ncbi:endonuclease/exonuclease/phosphatase family protein [Rhizobium sp. Root708]|uniref:endonuclease/exonuclease/phosphatase family protein n=1 Tax=Rhizobium sp. Root708 TaxID=1736592 RepID=UPI00138EE721|nr:endonuclease/exonuclease/phosphatase family protein [Rhizobium sp. Root708]